MKSFRSAAPALLVMGAVALCVTFVWMGASVLNTSDAVTQLADEQLKMQVAATEVQQRIVELPEDGQAYHVSICLNDDWQRRPQERAMRAWWSVDPRLVTLAAQTHFHVYTASDPVFRSNLAASVGNLPAVLIQDEKGKVLFKSSGENIPQTAPDLGDAVVSAFGRPYLLPYRNRIRPPCPCPSPSPKPAPNVDVNVNVPPRPLPDTPVKPTAKDFPWLLMIGLCLAAGLGVGAYHFIKPGGLR